MDFSQLTSFQRPRQYTKEDFMYKKVEEIKELEYDYEFYKREFRDKFDDEFLVLFDMLENADMSKKEVRIMGQMLKKMYEDKYKDVETIFTLKCEDVKAEDFKGEFQSRDVKEECELKEEEVIQTTKEYKEKQKEFEEDNYKGFYEILRELEESQIAE